MRLPLKKRIIVTVLVIAGLNSEFVMAQGTKFITLTEAIDLCLQNNKQLKLNKVQVSTAHASTEEAKEKRLPDASATGSYVRLTEPTIGGPLGRTVVPNVHEASYALVTVGLPIFNGFKIKNGIESAKYLEEATKLDADYNREAILQNTIAAYGNLYKANSNVVLLRENLKEAESRTRDFENLLNKGIVARNDLLRIQLQQSNIELLLMDAESNLKVTNLNMNLMLGLDESTQLQLDSTSFVVVEDTKTLGDFELEAFSKRYDVEALKYREKSAVTEIKQAKGDYFPSFKLTGGYVAIRVPGLITVTNAWNAGVGLNYNIASLWKTGIKVRSAKLNLEQVKANQEILNDRVRLEIAQAYEQYVLSKKKIDVYAEALVQAEENNKITKSKYRNNLVTTTELLDADIQQIQAEINYANSKADAVVAYNKLLQTSGIANHQSK